MLGYCGIDCDNCRAYQGTVQYDLSLLEKAAGLYWNGKYSAKDWVCLGCQPSNQPFLAKFCAECKIRVCAVQRKVLNCAACNDFEHCEPLQAFIRGESDDLVQKMQLLRNPFLDSQTNNC
jgi:hypothetical protein